MAGEEVQVLDAGGGQEVLESSQPHLDPITVTLSQIREEVPHNVEMWIPHILLRDQDAESRPAIESPAPRDELQLGLDVLCEQRHVVREIELGRGEDQRIAEDGLARHPPQLTRSQGSHRPLRPAP